METDIDNFHKMIEGDEKSLGELLIQYHNYLFVVGMRYLSDRQRVNDAIHDVFADLWNKRSDTSITSSVKSFLRGAVINKCLSIIRKNSRIDYKEDIGVNIVDKIPTPDQLIDAKTLKTEIEKIINGLPEKCQLVFKMSRYEGKSHREMSDELDISKKTIENHMTRALRSLRDGLKQKGFLFIIISLIKSQF